MDKKITITELGDSYKINIKQEGASMSTGYMVGMIIGFIFFLIVGVIMLVVWLVKHSNTQDINVDIIVPKYNWEPELDRQLLIYNFGADTDKIKLEIQNRIRVLNQQQYNNYY